MSDYSADTGKLKTLSYVHVTTTNNGQDLFIQCTCQIYNTIKCARLSQVDLQDGQDVVLDESLTCMHCRFYKEHLHQYREKYTILHLQHVLIIKSRTHCPLSMILLLYWVSQQSMEQQNCQ